MYAGNDDELFYILSQNDNNYKITILYDDHDVFGETVDVQPSSSAFAFCGGKFRFFENRADANGDDIFRYVLMTEYDCVSLSRTTRVINNTETIGGLAAFDGLRCYFPRNDSVTVISDLFKPEETFELPSVCSAVTAAPDGSGVYFACPNGLLYRSGSGGTVLPVITDTVVFSNGFIFDGSVFYDGAGSVVCGAFDRSRSGAYFGGCFVGNLGGELTAFRDGSTAVLGKADESSFICANGEVCACFTPDSGGVRAELFTKRDIENAFTIPDDGSGSSAEFGEYLVLASGTTAARYREESGTNAVFCKNGSEYSGKLATGMTVRIGGSESAVVIIGDVTGEGSVNSRDVNDVSDYIIGAKALSGAYLKAADVNGDGEVSVSDAATLHHQALNNNS